MQRQRSLLQRLKRIELKKSYIVILVILAVVVRFWGESSITMLQKEVPEVTTTELSADEINRYAQTKQEYFNERIHVAPEILVSRDLESYLDKPTHEWFLVRGWRPKRFFYAEERIKQILQYLHNREQKLDEANRLELQAKQMMSGNAISENDATAAEFIKQAQDIRYYIDREIRYAGVTVAEERAVAENQVLLEQLSEQD